MVFNIIMTLEEKIKKAETRQFKAIFPNNVNHYDTMFGGTALSFMDEVAFIAATRFSRQKMVTVATDKIDFNRPIPAGTIIEIIGHIAEVGNTSIKVRVEIFIEEMYSEKREKAIEGLFTLVAVGEDKNPVKIFK
jgi:acyl-CoA hydrolase